MDEEKLIYKASNLNIILFLISIILGSFIIYFDIINEPNYMKYYPYLWGFFYIGLNISIAIPLSKLKRTTNVFKKIIIASLASIVLLLFLGGIWLERTSPTTTGPYLLILAVFSALSVWFGWFIHIHLTNETQRKTHSLNLLMQSRLSVEFQKQLTDVGKFYSAGIAVEDSDFHIHGNFNKYIDSEKDNENDKAVSMKALKYILNFYEFMAVGIARRELDEDLLYESLNGIVLDLGSRTKLLRKHIQVKDSLSYCYFDALVERWKSPVQKDKLAQEKGNNTKVNPENES